MKHFSHSNKTIFSKDWNGAIENNGKERSSVKQTRNVKLNIQTTQPLKSEAEIDNYLQDLKKLLMKFIDNNYEVMVNK